MQQGIIVFNLVRHNKIEFFPMEIYSLWEFVEKATSILLSYDLEDFIKKHYDMILTEEQIKKYQIQLKEKKYIVSFARFGSVELAQMFLDEVIIPQEVAQKLTNTNSKTLSL